MEFHVLEREWAQHSFIQYKLGTVYVYVQYVVLCPILTHSISTLILTFCWLTLPFLFYTQPLLSSSIFTPTIQSIFIRQPINAPLKNYCNHRMWPKAKTVNSCWRVSLWSPYDSAALRPNPPPQPPPRWHRQEDERKQVIRVSDSNLPQRIHNCSHWVLPSRNESPPLSVRLSQTCRCHGNICYVHHKKILKGWQSISRIVLWVCCGVSTLTVRNCLMLI